MVQESLLHIQPVREIYGLLQKQTGQQQRYYFRLNTKGREKENVCNKKWKELLYQNRKWKHN